MPVPDPPYATPRVIKVLEPSAGQYEVVVRVDPTLAARFPDKPFGTGIDQIGLAVKDSDRYLGYTLVKVEPADQGGKDHLWTFQKLEGPEWKTTSNSKDNLTPAKFRGQVVVVKTEQEVVPGTLPSLTVGDLVASSVQQTPNTGKAVLTEVTETIDVNAAPLVGQQFSPDGALLTTSELVVPDGAPADKGVNIAQSVVSPFGNGKSVRDSSTANRRVNTGVTDLGTSEVGWPTKQRKSKGVGSVVPQKFRNSVVTVVTKTQEPLTHLQSQELPDPASPAGAQVLIEHEKVNDYRYEKAVTTEVIGTTPTLLGQKAYVEKVVADVKEEYLPTAGALAETGLNIIDSSLTALGNGKSIRDTVSIPLAVPANNTWPVHTSSQWDALLGLSVPVTEQYITPYTFVGADKPATIGESHRVINQHRALKTVEVVPTAALTAYMLSYPIKINLDLPRVLKSVGVVWNSQASIGSMNAAGFDFHNGESGSTSLSIPDSCSSSASVSAEILLTFEDFATGNLMGERKMFFLPYPITAASILARLSAQSWPVFKPRSETITTIGQSISVSAKVNVACASTWSKVSNGGSASKSASGETSVGLSNGAVQIPPCIHKEIILTGGTSQAQSVAAVASASVTTTRGISSTASMSRNGVARGSVSPGVLAATDGQNTIPTSGLYLMDMDVSPSKYSGWFNVRADVFDASALA